MNYIKILILNLLILLSMNSKLLSFNNTIIVEQNARKLVFVPHEDIGDDWKTDINYDDSSWSLCEGLPGGVGYEKSSGYEEFITLDVGNEMHTDSENPNLGCYIRIPFSIDENTLSSFQFLQLKIRYDDGFYAFLNGHPIKRVNVSKFSTWKSSATSDNEAVSMVSFNISSHIQYLVPGENLLAIHGMNTSTQSSDFLILPELVASDDLFNEFEPSVLPIFMIETSGKSIPDEPKITADLNIIYNGEGNLNHPSDTILHYNGKIGIEIRGSYSSTFPQKPYGIETRDEDGENLNISLLDMPKENDWILIPNFNDKSFVRSTLAFDLFRSMGHYAPRAKLCEVFVNSDYRGMYIFTEKIKRDKNRIDISKLKPEDITGDDLTGGYVIKIDYYNYDNSWLSDFSPMNHSDKKIYFVYSDPDATELVDEQKTYIQNFMKSTEGALYSDDFVDPDIGYRKYMDVNSFIDYFIVNEVSRNVDGYKKSRYFYKDKDSNGGLLHAGPVWDFDWAWKNINEGIFGVKNGSGWSYNYYPCYPNPPYWYSRLLQDATFTNQLIDRYFDLRNDFLDLDRINSYIDSVVTLVDDCKDRHFEIWPINQGYMTPETDPASQTYEQEIAKLKNWISTRILWLDENIPALSEKITTAIQKDDSNVANKMQFRSYPNPARSHFTIEANKNIDEVRIYNLKGQLIYHSKMNNHFRGNIDISKFPSGIYFVKLLVQGKKPIIYKQIFTE